MIKVLTIIGARPQIIKAATLSRIIKFQYSSRVCEVLVHTGQHYHDNMSGIFFKDMNIPEPKYNLGLGGLSHSVMIGKMMVRLEEIFLKEKPDWIFSLWRHQFNFSWCACGIKITHKVSACRGWVKKP